MSSLVYHLHNEVFYKHAKRPIIFELKKGLESSLYCLKIPKNLRVILVYDEDPLFEQVLITLIRVVRRDNLERILESIGELLYQYYLNENGGDKYDSN